MINTKVLDAKLAMAKKLSVELLKKTPVPLGDRASIPNTGGVYIFYNARRKIIYIGMARVLRRRIYTDHLSAERKDSMSSLRRTIKQVYKIAFGPSMRSWIIRNCKVAFLEIENADTRGMVEAYLICCHRSSDLLNKA